MEIDIIALNGKIYFKTDGKYEQISKKVLTQRIRGWLMGHSYNQKSSMIVMCTIKKLEIAEAENQL